MTLKLKKKLSSKNGNLILGIENRLEQVVANLLDNSISFSDNNQKIEIEIEETTKNLVILSKRRGTWFFRNFTSKNI